MRTQPIRRPREDIFLPEQNALSRCLFSTAGSGNRRNGALSLLAANLGTNIRKCAGRTRNAVNIEQSGIVPDNKSKDKWGEVPWLTPSIIRS